MKPITHIADLRRAAAITGVAALLLLAACSKQAPTEASKQAASDPKLFSVPQDQLAHLQVVALQPTSITRTLRLPGTVAYNAFTTTPVISQVSGPVGRIAVVPGQTVKAGQPMLYVSSPDFAQLRSNYIKARDAHALAHKNYARAQDLYAH